MALLLKGDAVGGKELMLDHLNSVIGFPRKGTLFDCYGSEYANCLTAFSNVWKVHLALRCCLPDCPKSDTDRFPCGFNLNDKFAYSDQVDNQFPVAQFFFAGYCGADFKTMPRKQSCFEPLQNEHLNHKGGFAYYVIETTSTPHHSQGDKNKVILSVGTINLFCKDMEELLKPVPLSEKYALYFLTLFCYEQEQKETFDEVDNEASNDSIKALCKKIARSFGKSISSLKDWIINITLSLAQDVDEEALNELFPQVYSDFQTFDEILTNFESNPLFETLEVYTGLIPNCKSREDHELVNHTEDCCENITEFRKIELMKKYTQKTHGKPYLY
uniref:Uncharacterized protein n=1 Tax=Amphimedon queenslandica TaxID=400682 RepID=A0A1X7VSU1_AMPQE